MINFGKCCNPVPGEPITGIVTKGRGIVIHSNTCHNLQQLMQRPERIMDVSWSVMKNNRFIAALYILGERRKNTLAEISEAVNSLDSVIIDLKMGTDNSLFNCQINVEVYDVAHLNKLITRIKRIQGVLSIDRLNTLT